MSNLLKVTKQRSIYIPALKNSQLSHPELRTLSATTLFDEWSNGSITSVMIDITDLEVSPFSHIHISLKTVYHDDPTNATVTSRRTLIGADTAPHYESTTADIQRDMTDFMTYELGLIHAQMEKAIGICMNGMDYIKYSDIKYDPSDYGRFLDKFKSLVETF